MIHSLRAAGTTFDCRQQRIAAMPDSAPVYFKTEPGNAYDPLAIAIVNEAGEHLGYVPQYADRDRRILNRQREQIRTALANGFVVARASKTGGFWKFAGYVPADPVEAETMRIELERKYLSVRVCSGPKGDYFEVQAPYGLLVQYYAVSSMYGFRAGEKDEDADAVSERKRGNSAQKKKPYEGSKYKGKDAQRRLDARNFEKESPERQKRENRHRRQEFKRGNDIKSSQLGWRYGVYCSEDEAREIIMERRSA